MKNLIKIILLLFCSVIITKTSAMERGSRQSGYYDIIPEAPDTYTGPETKSDSSFYQTIPTIDQSPVGRTAILNEINNLIKEARATKNIKDAYPKYEGAIAYLKQLEKNDKDKLMLSIYNELLLHLATDSSNIIVTNKKVVNQTISDAKDYLIQASDAIKKDGILEKLQQGILDSAAVIRAQQLLFDNPKATTSELAQNAKESAQILYFIKTKEELLKKTINKRLALAFAYILENELASGGDTRHLVETAKKSLKEMGNNIDVNSIGYKRLVNALSAAENN